MKSLDIDWLDLELAFRDATGTESFLDCEEGEVVAIVPGFPDEASRREQIRAHPGRYAPVVPIDADFARAVMHRFVERLPEGFMRRRLKAAERKIGVYTRSLEILREDPAVFAGYHRYEQAVFWDHVEAFLAAHHIVAEEPVPAVELFEAQGPGMGTALRSG